MDSKSEWVLEMSNPLEGSAETCDLLPAAAGWYEDEWIGKYCVM